MSFVKEMFKKKFHFHILFRFRDQNMYCFDVITRDSGGYMDSVDSELVIGQVFYFVKTNMLRVIGNRNDYPIDEGDIKKKVMKDAMYYVQMCKSQE